MSSSSTSSMQANNQTQCITPGPLLSVMNEENLMIVVIAVMGAVLVLCCVSSILCITVCLLCRRRHSRTGDVQESTKSNGYMMPVIKEEKDIENNEHMQTSVNTFGQNIIRNENVEKESETREQKETEATVHDTRTEESNGGGMDHTIQGPATSTNDKGPTDIDANNPLYIKHHNTTTVSSTEEDDDDSDHDYLDVLIPGENNGTTITGDSTIDHGEEDYENFSSIKLAEALNRQGKPIANLPSPPPRSPTTSGAAVMKSNRTPSNASKHDQMITQLANNLTSAATPPTSSSGFPKSNRTASNASSKHNQMIANLTSATPLSMPTNSSSRSATVTPTHNIGKHDPPETRPKPKHKQRNPSNASSHNEPLVSPTNTDEPHYMPLKSANQAKGQFYKELDFSTFDPNNEYVVPRFT